MAGNTSSAPTERSNPVATIRSLADLIDTEHRARVYTALLLADDGVATPQELCETLSVPRATIYEDLLWLVEEELATRKRHWLTISVPGNTRWAGTVPVAVDGTA